MFSVLQDKYGMFRIYSGKSDLDAIRNETWISNRLKEIENGDVWFRPVLIDEEE